MSPLLLGAVLGATGAFVLDPELGRRRRALIRDKVTRGVTEGREFADAATQDLQHRARGLRARVGLRAGQLGRVLISPAAGTGAQARRRRRSEVAQLAAIDHRPDHAHPSAGDVQTRGRVSGVGHEVSGG